MDGSAFGIPFGVCGWSPSSTPRCCCGQGGDPVPLYPAVPSNPARQDLRVALGAQRWVLEPLHVLVLTGILALVGSRVAALVVLEFSLRAISPLLSLSKVSGDRETKTW